MIRCYRAIVLAYNIPGVTNLVLTREQIVGIYNGSINNWSDPTFVEHNPAVDMPNATIVPVARHESAGTTEILTTSLSSFSSAWAAHYGVFNKPTGWNSSVVKVFAQRVSGMADFIRREPYRIGYLTPASAVEVNLPYASIINQRGRVSVGNKKSVQAAMDERSQNMSSRLTSSLIDCKGEETYPMAGYTYIIIRMKQAGNCSVAVELARYIEWFLTNPRAKAEVENNLMVPVSPNIANMDQRLVLERMTCDEQILMDLVRQQKYDEEESLKTWKLPVQIVTPLITVCIIFLVVYAIRQRVRYIRMLDRDDWKIDFVVPKRRWRRSSNAVEDVDALPPSETYPDRWNIQEVVTKPLRIASVFSVNRKVKQMLMQMRDEIGHENIARFFGISSHNDAIYLVEQYCANGTLVQFLDDNKHIVNQSFRYVICADIADGMAYLHRQNLIHGNLSIDKCHVDSRWTIKIVDWEYTAMYDVVRRTEPIQAKATRNRSVLHFLCGEGYYGGRDFSQAFRHLAPELQKDGRLSEPTRAGDVYSFGVIIRDLFVNLAGEDLQPTSAAASCKMPVNARQIMKIACDKAAVRRPTFDQLEQCMRSTISGGKKNLLDRCVDCEL